MYSSLCNEGWLPIIHLQESNKRSKGASAVKWEKISYKFMKSFTVEKISFSNLQLQFELKNQFELKSKTL